MTHWPKYAIISHNRNVKKVQKSMQKADRMMEVRSDIRGPLFEEALRMQREGVPVMKLNTGNPAAFGFEMPASIQEALRARLTDATAYCDLRGMPEARAALEAAYHADGVTHAKMDSIYLGNGVSELVNMSLSVILNPGDELLMPAPCYTLWSNCARLAEAKPVFYRCDESARWQPDLDDLRAKITARTRGIVVINPNNPTGVVYPRETLEAIVEIARENRLILFADEIYSRLVMDGKPFTYLASLADDVPILSYGGLSKSHVVCGMRCGWLLVTGPETLTHDIETGLTQLASMRLCGNTMAQLAVPAALADREYTLSMIQPGGRLYEQREATMRVLDKIEGLSCVRNDAAFYVFPRIDLNRIPIDDDRDFLLDLLHETHVLMVPGSGFEWDAPDHFRIVMLPRPEEITAAFARIGEFFHARSAR